MSRLIVVPRWGSTTHSDFYPWLRKQAAPHFDQICMAPLLPDSSAPQIVPCTAALRALVHEGDPEDVVLVGHSIGCQVVLRTLLLLGPAKIAGCVLVAAWLNVDVKWPALRPWLRSPVADAPVKAAAGDMRVVISDDDPYRPDWEVVQEEFTSRFGASVRVEEGRRHFTSLCEPAVLEEVRALAPARRQTRTQRA